MKVNKYQIIGIALIIIIINFIIGNFTDFSKVFNYWFSIVRPIVIGTILAYFIYPLVMLIYNKTNNEALRFKHLNYYVSIFIAYFIIFIFFSLVYVLISPI
ncbi:MAG: hypothetical protein LBT75_02080, partial [Bacilli bacterium]|nr:hypothetical protein [Bacilli bacterium]